MHIVHLPPNPAVNTPPYGGAPVTLIRKAAAQRLKRNIPVCAWEELHD